MIIIAHILFYFFFIVIVFVVLRFHSSKMKGETWSAPKTDRVSVARNKSNAQTPQTSFR